jgi:hypothetical protein
MNLLERMFKPRIGEMEVITVRTPEGGYHHQVILNGQIDVSKAEVEEAMRKNTELYQSLNEAPPITDPVIALEDVRTRVVKRNYTTKSEFTFPKYIPKEENHSTSIVGAW